MTEFDSDFDPEEEDYDKNEFQKYLTPKYIFISVIAIGLSVFGLRRITGVGLSLSDVIGSSDTTFSKTGGEVFLMQIPSNGRDLIVLYDTKSEKRKELFGLSAAAKDYPNNQFLMRLRASKDGKSICFCKRINPSNFVIYRMDETGYNFNQILKVDTCNYNFKSDGKGIIYTDKSERLFSIDFDTKIPKVIMENSTEMFLDPIIYQDRLYYIYDRTFKVKYLRGTFSKDIYKFVGPVSTILSILHHEYFEFSPDWKHLILTDSERKMILIYDREKLEIIKRFRPIENVPNSRVSSYRPFFSPNGQYIYIHQLLIVPTEQGELREELILRINYQFCLEDGKVDPVDGVRVVEYEVVKLADDIDVNISIIYRPMPFVNFNKLK